MEILFEEESSSMNEALLERVNPAYKTAATTLSGLAAGANDEDARALTEKMHISEKDAMNSKRSNSSDENILINEIVMDTRFHTMNRLALESGASLIVDLPCGYTPRGIKFSRKNQHYLGLDLPASISASKEAIMSLIDDDKKHFVRYEGCDATNLPSATGNSLLPWTKNTRNTKRPAVKPTLTAKTTCGLYTSTKLGTSNSRKMLKKE